MAKICNEDCFNCRYEDCINDSLGRYALPEPKKLSMDPHNVRRRATYAKNRERYCAQKRQYYQENKEKIQAKRRKKPEERIKRVYKCRCAHCKHFVRRELGKKGGLWGMCEVSTKDIYQFTEWGMLRPVGQRNRCTRFERLEDESD